MNAIASSKVNPNVKENEPAEAQNYVAPDVNIVETKEGYVLEADLPGVSKDGLSITLEGSMLTLAGQRGNAAPDCDLIYRESKSVNFRRVFELDPAIDTGKISAKLEQGVLTLTLPKTERVKPRKIAVTD